jgi:hypothetical protein
MIWIMLSENFHRTFPADDVDQVSSGVIKDVVSVTNRGQAGNDSHRSCIQNNQPGRESASDEQPVVGVIQSHRIVREQTSHSPFGDDRTFPPVNNGDSGLFGDIYVNSISAWVPKVIDPIFWPVELTIPSPPFP